MFPMLRISDFVRRMFHSAVAPQGPTRPIRTRLSVEGLEAREVPANLTVAPLVGDVTEGGTATFRVTRDGGTSTTLIFVMQTFGTATSGSDYTALTSSYGQIPSGSSYT